MANKSDPAPLQSQETVLLEETLGDVLEQLSVYTSADVEHDANATAQPSQLQHTQIPSASAVATDSGKLQQQKSDDIDIDLDLDDESTSEHEHSNKHITASSIDISTTNINLATQSQAHLPEIKEEEVMSPKNTAASNTNTVESAVKHQRQRPEPSPSLSSTVNDTSPKLKPASLRIDTKPITKQLPQLSLQPADSDREHKESTSWFTPRPSNKNHTLSINKQKSLTNIEEKKMTHGIAKLEDCTTKQLLYIIDKLCETQAKVRENKQLFTSYFVRHQLDGAKMKIMSRKDFAIRIAEHYQENKLKGPAMKVYDGIKKYIIQLKKLEVVPSYIHKAIWYESVDTKLELLVDEAVRQIWQLDQWNDANFVKKMYQGQKSYREAVQTLYKQLGGVEFFDNFIDTYYRREMNILGEAGSEMDDAAHHTELSSQHNMFTNAATIMHGGGDFDDGEELGKRKSSRRNTKHGNKEYGSVQQEEEEEDDKDVRWAVFIPYISQSAHHRFIYRHQLQERPNGFWMILSNDVKYDRKSLFEGISTEHQKASILSLDELHQIDRDSKHMEKSQHVIGSKKYIVDRYTKYNEPGMASFRVELLSVDEPNIQRPADEEEKDEEKKDSANGNDESAWTEMCYFRYKRKKHVQWRWYNNDTATYQDFSNELVMDELEVSYLANVKEFFNPNDFQFRFSLCLLPQLGAFLNYAPEHRDYVFSCNISPTNEFDKKGSNFIMGMDQICYDHTRPSSFARSLQRYDPEEEEGKKPGFKHQWKLGYKLYTPSQQLYFFAYIVGVVAMMKYIDIELANQPIALPIAANLDGSPQDPIQRFVQTEEARNEKYTPVRLIGYFVSPEIVNSASQERSRPINTKKLQKVKLKPNANSAAAANQELYAQNGNDIFFDRREAEFFRLMEHIRKYVLEDTTGESIWPWYRNTFHCDDKKYIDVRNYEGLILKHGLLSLWSVDDLKAILHDHIGEESEVNEAPNRVKRKFAARMLLSPSETVANVALIRRQLKLLLRDIMNKAIAYNSKLVLQHEHQDNRAPPSTKLSMMDLVAAQISQQKSDDIGDSTHYEVLLRHTLEQNAKYKQDTVRKYCINVIQNTSKKKFWPNQIKKTNEKYQKEQYDNHEDLDSLDIDRFQLPIFEQFMAWFFEATDAGYDEKENKEQHLEDWDARFIQSWRSKPFWYTYEHDVLLLELAIRNGLDCEKIVADLNGDRTMQYKSRLQCNEDQGGDTTDDPYYEFERWCGTDFNVLHRLKYVTNTIVRNLQLPQFGGETPLLDVEISEKEDRPKYMVTNKLFSDYQQSVHVAYLKEEPIQNEGDLQEKEDNDNTTGICCASSWHCCNGVRTCRCCRCCCCFCYEDNSVALEVGDSSGPITPIRHQHASGKYEVVRQMQMAQLSQPTQELNGKSAKSQAKDALVPRIRMENPFIHRNQLVELAQVLQCVNLKAYGMPLVKCIVNQIKKHNLPTYWDILDEVLNALPYPMAIAAINTPEIKVIVRHLADPQKIDKICYRLVKRASFPASAALQIAEFFEDLAEVDVVEDDQWDELKEKYSRMAYDEMSSIESNHALFLLLNIPAMRMDNEHYTLLQVALQSKRIEVLQNDRVNNLVLHLYQHRFLKPKHDIKMKSMRYWQMLQVLFSTPFKFYFSAQGYYWTTGIIYFMYLAFVFAFSYTQPISGTAIQLSDEELSDHKIKELALWILNLGYIIFEVQEAAEKGITKYFKMGVSGQTNIMDAAICFIWIILFALRLRIIDMQLDFDGAHVTQLQQPYMFIFGVQIVILTMRGLTLFSNTPYLGTLIRIIKLMIVEITKFLSIFVVMVIGFFFGIWLINSANECRYEPKKSSDECIEYELMNPKETIKYVFEVFIGTGDLGGVVNQGIGISFMVIATMFGTLVLTNLLIALMTTEYENVREAAKGEVIYNQAELIYDLSKRRRILPPPLNIFVIVFTCIVHIICFIPAILTSCACCCNLNIYDHIDYHWFSNLQKFSIWQCDHHRNKDFVKKPPELTISRETSRICDVLKIYWIWILSDMLYGFLDFTTSAFRCITCKKQNTKVRKSPSRRHHKGCYGVIMPEHLEGKVVLADTMDDYIRDFEKQHQGGQKLEENDSKLLKKLTTNTLFCKYCYKPFLMEKGKVVNSNEELSTPYSALADLISAFCFVFVAWIPLIFVFIVMTLKDWLFLEVERDEEQTSKNFNHIDFDEEYYPNQFRTLT